MKLKPNVLQQEATRQARVKPLPLVVVHKSQPKKPVVKPEPEPVAVENETLNELQLEEIRVRKQRAILSTRTHQVIAQCEARLLREGGAAVLEEFRQGNLPMPELAEHYAEIQKLSDEIKRLYNEQELSRKGPGPVVKQEVVDEDPRLLQYEIRRLDDQIYKTKLKLKQSLGGLKQPRNTDRVNMWKETIGLAELKREELKSKLKKMRAL